MTFVESIKTCLGKVFTIEGRASRSEYWWFFLFFYGFILTVFIVSSITQQVDNRIFSTVYDLIKMVVLIGMLIITIALITCRIRRLHDIGRSGWWIFIGLIPYVGSLILLLWFIKGSDGDNEYGPDPTGESFYYEEYHPET